MTQSSPKPQPAPQPVQLNTGGDMTVGGDVVGGDKVTVNVTLTGDLLAQLEQIKALSTELTRAALNKTAAPAPTPAPAAPSAEALKSVDAALDLLQRGAPAGAPAQELKSGGLQISRVELLLKKAILLETEADEILEMAQRQAGGAPGLPADYDDAPRLAKLREAEQLLRDINQLDPANTEMLLHLAQVSSLLRPDDWSEAFRLLNRVEQLLSAPKDDVEKFRLGQAKLYMAGSQNPPNEAGLREARALFEDLGRHQWVEYADTCLAQVAADAGFNPLGPWLIETPDKAETVIGVMLLEDGQCEGWRATKSQAQKGTHAPFVGEWGFDVDQGILRIQGELETGRLVNLEVQLQDQDEAGWHALDEKGRPYLLNRPPAEA